MTEENTVTGTEAGKAFTQEDVDRIVADRLRREREKFADYETLKERATEAERLEQELNQSTQRVGELEPKLTRLEVAMEKGLPGVLADRLRGETAEDLAEDADRLLELVAPAEPVPAGDPRPDPAQGRNRDGVPGLNDDRLLTDLKSKLGVS